MFKTGIDKQTFVLYNLSEQLFRRHIMRHYRIKNKFRFITFMIIAVLAVSLSIGALFPIRALDNGPEYTEVKVKDGDTLWSLAKAYGDPAKDIRERIYDICSINDITAETLYAGAVIRIPQN